MDANIFCDERRVEEDKKREERGEQKIGNILDKENGKLNFNNKTATSMGSNKRVYTIEPTDEDLETKRENLKIKIMEKYNSYIKDKCDRKGNIKENNISDVQESGMKSFSEKARENKVVVTDTDKSEKISVMRPDTYTSAMDDHTKNDKEIDFKEANKVSSVLNKHARSMAKILGIGKAYSEREHKRALANSTVHRNGEFPVMRGSDKDHKRGRLQLRPICNGMAGPKKPLSEMVSDALENILEYQDHDLCDSTEGMIHVIEKYNKENGNKNLEKKKIVGSMDVKSLYPKLRAEPAAEIVKESIKMSKIKLDGLDVEEMGKFLRMSMSTKEIEEKGLKEILSYKRRKKKKKCKERKGDDKGHNSEDYDLANYLDIENMFKDIDDVEKLDTSDISVDSDDDDGVQDATLKGEDKEEELNGKKENDFQNSFECDQCDYKAFVRRSHYNHKKAKLKVQNINNKI